MESINELRDRVNDKVVRKYDKVVGTGVGTKWVGGQDTGRPALLVFVVEKDHGIHALSANDQLVPPDLEGFETDVIEVGKLVKHGYTQLVRPIQPGYSASHYKVPAGTLGGIFLDRDNQVVALSNNHVFANEGDCTVGDLIFQPGPADNPIANQLFTGWDNAPNIPYFATLKDYCQLSFNTGKNEQDSAIAQIHEHYITQRMISNNYPSGGAIASFVTPQVGMAVQKFGRTTSRTEGKILGINSEFTVAYDHGNATFTGCIVTSSMSRGGDSGSILLDGQTNAVGLLFGGSDKVSIHIPIQTVARRYGLQPWTTTESAPVRYWGRDWRQDYNQTVAFQPDFMIIEAYAHQHAYLETTLTAPFTILELEIFTASDMGTTWGPGLALVYPGGVFKLNERSESGFGGGWNGEVSGIGSSRRFNWYKLRVHYTNDKLVGEVIDGQTIYTVLEVPVSNLGGSPSILRIGKTDMTGGRTDYSELGLLGRSHYRGFSLR